MSTVIDVGALRITALNDGTIRLPPLYYPGLDFDAHPDLVDVDGTYHIPAGCFLIQGDGVCILVDAGLGPAKIPFPQQIATAAGLEHPPEWIAEGGLLPGALAAVGVEPSNIRTVFITHLHADHIGWVAPDGHIFFPNAEVVYAAAEEVPPTNPAPGELEGRAGLEIAKAAGMVRTIESATFEIAAGVVAHHTPGHTPGHYVVSVSSNGEQAYLLGDVVHHPLQLNAKTISFVSETDPGHALRTREQLITSFAGCAVSLGMTHFPELDFQRITTENGRRWTTV